MLGIFLQREMPQWLFKVLMQCKVSYSVTLCFACKDTVNHLSIHVNTREAAMFSHLCDFCVLKEGPWHIMRHTHFRKASKHKTTPKRQKKVPSSVKLGRNKDKYYIVALLFCSSILSLIPYLQQWLCRGKKVR